MKREGALNIQYGAQKWTLNLSALLFESKLTKTNTVLQMARVSFTELKY